VASVVGRGFDLGILREIHPIATNEAELAAQLCELEGRELLARDASQQSYLFRHAIVQDVAYGMLPFAQRRPLHGAVARSIERAAGEGPRPYPLLAHHWREAGEAPEALACFTAAGEQAAGNYANFEAIRFFRSALELDRQVAPAARRRSLLEVRLGKAYVNVSDYGQANPHIQEGLKLLGLPVPVTRAGQASRVLLEILRQTAHRLRPAHYLGRKAQRRDLLLAGAAAYEGLVELYYYTNQPLLWFVSAFRTLNLSEAAGSSAELARSYALIGMATGSIPIYRLADAYCRRAEEIAEATADPAALLWVAVVNGVFYTGAGRWDQATRLYGRAIELGRRLGDERRWCDAVGNLADVCFFQGDGIEALRLLDELQASAARRNDERYLVAALRSRTYNLMALGRDEEAWSCLEEVRRLAASGELAERELTELDLHGLGALLRLRRGDAKGAREAADRALALRARLSPMVSFYNTVVSCAAVAEVYLGLWESQAPGAGDAGELRRSAQRACKALWKLARIYPMCRASAWLLQGRLEALSGRPARARQSWETAIREARERATPRYAEAAARALRSGEGRR